MLTPFSSSMTGRLDVPGCYSVVSDYKPTTGCYEYVPSQNLVEYTKTFIYGSQTVTNEYGISLATPAATKTVTVTFDDDDRSSLVGVSYMPMVTLVHHQSDLQSAATSTAESTSTGSTGAAKTSNAARRLTPQASTWDGFGAVLGASVAAIALGMGIIFQ